MRDRFQMRWIYTKVVSAKMVNFALSGNNSVGLFIAPPMGKDIFVPVPETSVTVGSGRLPFPAFLSLIDLRPETLLCWDVLVLKDSSWHDKALR